MNIASDAVQSVNIFSGKELQSLAHGFNAPFRLILTDNTIIEAVRVLRLVPGRRMVVAGKWQDKPIVAKLFFDVRRAQQHADQEALGNQLLRDHKIPTPELYFQGKTDDQRVHVLVFEYLLQANSLAEVWRNTRGTPEAMLALEPVMIELATQHVLGITQDDMHLDNFMVSEKTIYTLDSAQLTCCHHRLEKKESMNNVALFLSQLGTGTEHEQEALFRYYAKARGWRLKTIDLLELFYLIKKWDKVRWQHHAKKIFRNSTHYAMVKTFKTRGMLDRAYAGPALTALLNNPEQAFQDPSAVMLKAGRSATVVKITVAGREWVVKRYNLKNTAHWLRRCLRDTRAHKSWRLGQLFALFGLSTAKPIAFIEHYCLGFRSHSYYISEYVSELHIGRYFTQTQDERAEHMVTRIGRLLKGLRNLSMTHGDLKATNILIDAQGDPVLIDLDGATLYKRRSRLMRAYAEETTRLMDNFLSQPAIYTLLQKELV